MFLKLEMTLVVKTRIPPCYSVPLSIKGLETEQYNSLYFCGSVCTFFLTLNIAKTQNTFFSPSKHDLSVLLELQCT